MPSELFHVSGSAQCSHQSGQVQVVTTNTRVKVSNMAVATTADRFTVAGCLFTVGTKAQPCTTVRWTVVATRVKVLGKPVILRSSRGTGFSAEQIPQGPPSVIATQTRVKGT